MAERFQRFLDRLESRIALLAVLGGSTVFAVISAWIASATNWLDQYGPISWWFAALLGFLIALLIARAIVNFWYSWVSGRMVKQWQQRSDYVNPLEEEFHRVRIKVQDFVNPLHQRITVKRFYDCELVGPAIIYVHPNNTLINTGFVDCDIFTLNPQRNTILKNAIALEGSAIHGCKIISCTLVLHPDLIPAFRQMGAEFLTITEQEENVNG